MTTGVEPCRVRHATRASGGVASWPGARSGVARARSGDPFKAGTLRSYDQALRLRVYPAIGQRPFYRVRRVELQDVVDRLVAAGIAPATIGMMTGALAAI